MKFLSVFYFLFTFSFTGRVTLADQLDTLDRKHAYDLALFVSHALLGGTRRPYLSADLDLTLGMQIVDRFDYNRLRADQGIGIGRNDLESHVLFENGLQADHQQEEDRKKHDELYPYLHFTKRKDHRNARGRHKPNGYEINRGNLHDDRRNHNEKPYENHSLQKNHPFRNPIDFNIIIA